jgi:puromycin-sensitive aminopeptidase
LIAQVNSETSSIQLNSAELKFDKAIFEYDSGSRKVESTKVDLCEESEVATINFSEKLHVGSGKLHISYTGFLNEKLKGFYRSKYVHPSGEVKYAATTQFEAADARRAFPCWDEPALKSTFDVTIVADGDKTVLSNMVTLKIMAHIICLY